MATHRLDRRASALVVLALLGLAGCSDDPAPVLQTRVTAGATEATGATDDEPLTFMPPDRSSNVVFGLSDDGPERTDVHGSYHQAAIADDSPVFQYSPDVVSPEVQAAYTPNEIAEAQRKAVTFFVQEYIDSEMVADDSAETRAVVEQRLRAEFPAGDFWDTELPTALTDPDCTYLVDCRSTTRDAALGRTLAGGSGLRFTLLSFATTEIFLGDEGAVVVRIVAHYERGLGIPDQEHAFETTSAQATYAVVTDGSAWLLDGWEVEIASLDVGALVEGGSESLPFLEDVDWGTVPSGFTPQSFEGVDYALAPEWERGGEEAWAWLPGEFGDDIVVESFIGPELEPSGERADLAVVMVPKSPGMNISEVDWAYAVDGASYRVEVPGAEWSTGEFKPVSYDERDMVDVWVETDDAYLWFTMYAERGEGEPALRELAQTITVP